MINNNSTKQDVRQFYDQVGWQKVSDDTYQNAQYEDLRPVSRAYIHKCHMRVNRHLNESGKYLLDAGSGPIQYPEYLTYSSAYQYRVCLDISFVALAEARERIGTQHGMFVVGDVANLPFKDDSFDGIVSLHTLHHLPAEDYIPAFHALKRVLTPGGAAVVVNGWSASGLMNLFRKPILFMERRTRTGQKELPGDTSEPLLSAEKKPSGTFVHKLGAASLRQQLGQDFPVEIRVWRSVSVRFLRAMIHPFLLGRFWLWVLYILEELSPRFFGEKGQYPLITFKK
jgi:ubiquinone/menaquinone biosynthesis C-methylase UbiE